MKLKILFLTVFSFARVSGVEVDHKIINIFFNSEVLSS